MSMIVFTLQNRLFIHSHELIKSGKILIISSEGKIVENIQLLNQDSYTGNLRVKNGKYLVHIESESGIYNKYVFVNNNEEGSNGTMR